MPEDRKVTKLTCPYNVAHEIVPERFQQHLFKCREQYKVTEYEPCPYNAAHDVPVPEMQWHKKTCSDRLKVDKIRYKIGEVQEDPNSIVPDIDLPDDSEDWDNPRTSSSYLDVRENVLKTKPVLVSVVGETQSTRKKFYQGEAYRHEDLGEYGREEPRHKSAGRGVHLNKSPESKSIGRGSTSRIPQTSVGESSNSGRVGSASLASLRRSLDEDRETVLSSEASASKSSRMKEEPVDSDDDDDGFQIVVRGKGRGRGKKF